MAKKNITEADTITNDVIRKAEAKKHKFKNASAWERGLMIASWVFVGLAVAFFISAIIPSTFVYEHVWMDEANPTAMSIWRSFFYIVTFLSFSKVIRAFTWFIFSHGDSKTVTIARLSNSIFKYLVVIVLLFVILAVWHVDTSAIIASAGVVAIIISFGVQALIADLLGGLTIVFEDIFNVGDYVLIDGFRGVVTEIGLMATKVIDPAGNVKSIKNSIITTSVNLSKNPSTAICDVSVDYSTDLETLRTLIETNLDNMSEQIPELKTKLIYGGVDSLSDSGIGIRFFGKCDEAVRFRVARKMNEVICNFLTKNGIKIPFNQITISKRED